MSNERRLRLVQVAKEFKVGINTITDFLRKSGIKSDGSPNSIVEPDVYATLEREYGSNRGEGNDRNSVRERISKKQASVSIESEVAEPQSKSVEAESEVMIKSNIVEKKPQISQPTVLGRIELSPKQTQRYGSKQQHKSKAVAPKETPKVAPKAEVVVPVVEKPTPAPTPEVVAAPVVVTPEVAPVETPTTGDNHRSNVQNIGIPQVLGTIDVSGFTAGGKGKHKRKRLSKEKVDINRVQSGNKPAAGGQGGARTNNNQNAQGGGKGGNNSGGGQNRGGNAQQRPGGGNAAAPGQGRRNKGAKGAPKPVIRPEVSDEEVSKQVKDTLARLTAKGAKNKGAKYRKEKRDAQAERANEEFEREEMERSTLKVTEFVTVSELATMMSVSVTEVISACMNLGLMV
ncbi:MAG: translation initiation factor IF-2 N-terminal domain-containing protein, partial [Rikenellaceae bacterium]